MTYNITSKPTMYNGAQFRSRLEAKWAAFFDMCDRAWEYEPFDCDGYVPDFLLHGTNRSALVEVKPEPLYEPESYQIKQAVGAAHAMGYHLIVLFDRWTDHKTTDMWKHCGVIYQHLDYIEGPVEPMPATVWFNELWRLDFGAEDLISNTLDGVHCSPFEGAQLQKVWRAAGNSVQWKAA